MSRDREEPCHRTKELAEASAIIAAGGRLAGLEKRSHRSFVFLLAPESLCRQLSQKFHAGELPVDALKMTEAIEHLKDVLFKKLRDNGDRDDEPNLNPNAL